MLLPAWLKGKSPYFRQIYNSYVLAGVLKTGPILKRLADMWETDIQAACSVLSRLSNFQRKFAKNEIVQFSAPF